MHIAICDDNIADRKQTERLMKREADRMISSGDPMYIDSFGNSEALLKTPMQYDAFLIDIRNTEGVTSADVLFALRKKGVSSPICIIYPREDDSFFDRKDQDIKYPTETLFLGKPLRPAELHETLLKLKRLAGSLAPSIELRGEFETNYVSEEEIISVSPYGNKARVTLTENREKIINGDAYTLFMEITKEHDMFVMPSLNTVINLDYVDHIRFGTIYLTNGQKFRCHRKVLAYVKHYLSGAAH